MKVVWRPMAEADREIVVRPNYVMVYRIEDDGGTLAVLRVLHARQQWSKV